MARRYSIARLLCSFAALGFSTAVSAQDAAPAAAPPQSAPHAIAKPYAIEFRARNAQSYGHTFSIYGRLDARGRIVKPTVSGLHPATESPIPWMIGHIVAVPSETGPSDGDTEDQYVLARFRILLSESEYKKVLGFIKKLNDKSPVWHAVTYNCNAYVGEIATFMGLRATQSTMLMPQDYIEKLRDLNINRTDLAGMIGTPVKVPDAEALRTEALKALEHRSKVAAPKPAGTATARAATAPTGH